MADLQKSIPEQLARAIRVVLDEETLDVYAVREREARGWTGPRVRAITEARMVLERYAAPPEPRETPAPLTFEEAVAKLPEADRERILAALGVSQEVG